MITYSSFTPTHKIYLTLFFWRVVSYPLISRALILLTLKKSSNVKNFITFVYTSLIKLDCIQAANTHMVWECGTFLCLSLSGGDATRCGPRPALRSGQSAAPGRAEDTASPLLRTWAPLLGQSPPSPLPNRESF